MTSFRVSSNDSYVTYYAYLNRGTDLLCKCLEYNKYYHIRTLITYQYTHAYIHTYLCMYICMYVCIYVYMYVCMYVRKYVHACIHTCIHTCIHINVHTLAHTHAHIYIHRTELLYMQGLIQRLWKKNPGVSPQKLSPPHY